MSQLGHSRHFERAQATSAYHPLADIRCAAAPLGDQAVELATRPPHGGELRQAAPSSRAAAATRLQSARTLINGHVCIA